MLLANFLSNVCVCVCVWEWLQRLRSLVNNQACLSDNMKMTPQFPEIIKNSLEKKTQLMYLNYIMH